MVAYETVRFATVVERTTSTERSEMAVVSQENARLGYLLDSGEGEAFWLLGMLEIVKIGGASTNGEYGLLEVTVRAGEGSPWHVHPDEDEWFYVLEGEFTVYVGDERLTLT